MKSRGHDFQSTERFVIQRRLGTGGMGAGYEAFDRERNETVALKVLRGQDPAAIYRLKKAFRVRSDVAHPHLVSLYELVAEGDDWFYTMELVDGGRVPGTCPACVPGPVCEVPPQLKPQRATSIGSDDLATVPFG